MSGDRESQVQYLAREVGITEVHAEQTPEQKLALVRAETALAPTLYVGDGINDAPAMMAATVGMAIGEHSDVTAEAAGGGARELAQEGGLVSCAQPRHTTFLVLASTMSTIRVPCSPAASARPRCREPARFPVSRWRESST